MTNSIVNDDSWHSDMRPLRAFLINMLLGVNEEVCLGLVNPNRTEFMKPALRYAHYELSGFSSIIAGNSLAAASC